MKEVEGKAMKSKRKRKRQDYMFLVKVGRFKPVEIGRMKTSEARKAADNYAEENPRKTVRLFKHDAGLNLVPVDRMTLVAKKKAAARKRNAYKDRRSWKPARFVAYIDGMEYKINDSQTIKSDEARYPFYKLARRLAKETADLYRVGHDSKMRLSAIFDPVSRRRISLGVRRGEVRTSVKVRKKESIIPLQSLGYRNYFCPNHGKCLDKAAEKKWESFSCSLCPHKRNKKGVVKEIINNNGGDSIVEYISHTNLDPFSFFGWL